ncbi:hypothetical protein GQ457_17G009920 [Hibiscus cannabinus]
MIYRRRPWAYHDEFFSIKPYNPALTVEDYDFKLMTIWVRVYRLPLCAMNRDTDLCLGSTVGKALRVDHRIEGGNMGEFLRILVQMDIRKPLRRCVLLGVGLGKPTVPCPLRYERLSEFCFYCGLVGHDLAACSSKPAALDNKQLQYGSWLRVQTQQPRPGPRRRTGIEYFTEPAMASTETPPSNPPASVKAAAPTSIDSAATGSSPGGAVMTEAAAASPAGVDIGHGVSASTPSAATTVIPPETVEENGGMQTVDAAASFEKGSRAALVAVGLGSSPQADAGSRPDVVAVDLGPSTQAVPSLATSAMVLQQSAGTVVVEGASRLANSPLTDSLLAPQQVKLDGKYPLAVHPPTTMMVNATSPTRISKRALQGKYEVCTPIQPKRSRLCTSLGSENKNSGMSSLNSSTEVAESSSSRIQYALNMDGFFVVDYGNGCTGLMVLWNRRITVDLLSYSSIHIDVIVTVVSGSFHFSGLHGHCVEKHKHLTWSLLDRLRSSSALPWLVGGDLNEILCHSEKEGGRRKLPGFLDSFRDCLDRNYLLDCKPISGWFTWLYVNSVSGSVIQERLDRFLATTDWFSLFPEYRVSSFYTAKSDHCFLLMDATQVNVSAKGETRDYFRFDNCWSKEEACIERVRSSWLHSPGSTASKLRAIGDSLRSWQADRHASSTKRMSDLQGFLNSCTQGSITDEAKAAFLDAKREHKSLLDKDEAYWAQQARVTWLTQGDRNTAYFHAHASGRRKKNRIRGLFNENGIWTDKQAEVAGVAMRYFSTLFSSSQPTPNSTLLSNIDHCISSDDNNSLLRPFTDTGILAAFQDINPTKAPGIDGLPDSFFRQHWELIGSDILQLCHDLLSRKVDMSCVNATVITLIPKVEDPMRMHQLRPISLCTVVYMILLHYLCSSKNGPNKGAALMLDMEKAFDRVEWTFLRSVLLRMGFHSDWVDLLVDCVSTVTFRIRVNGRLSSTVVPQRGLRQGDPLSPFLFVICMQGLSATLLAEHVAGRILGIRASQKGQRINFGKSTVFYSPNTPSTNRHRISAILGIAEVFDPSIYLGVPLRVGKNKTNVFGFLNEKVDDRVSGWTKRLLSFGVREIFLKSVAQALPLYIMSCYLLPRTITDRITSSMRRYWWSGKLSERGWPLLAWDKICTPKNAGGLGLRDLRRFNIALLGKQLWQFLVFPDSLVARVFLGQVLSFRDPSRCRVA